MHHGGTYNLIASLVSHQNDLLRFLARRTGCADRASEIVQDIYLRLVARPESGPMIDNPRAYLFRVAANLAVDAMRKEARTAARSAPERLASEMADPIASPEARLAARERLRLLDETLAELSPNVRRALLMSRVDGATFAAISAELGVSESMVAKYLAQALRACQDRLRQAENER